MPTGHYIICSGGEGTGKSTLRERLSDGWRELVISQEPGALPFGQGVRSLILDPAYDLDPWAQFYLFMADRANHMAKLVKPKLAEGKTVFSDRGFPDTFAYQLYTRLGFHDPEPFLREITARGWPMPSLWILLDLDPVIGLQRRRNAGGENILDQQKIEFHESVRAGFHVLADRAPFPVAIIDAAQSPDEVSIEVKSKIEHILDS